jgi:hypothetical protein
MRADLYTRTLLTVIAVALTLIAVQQTTPRASAQFGKECGSRLLPCYVEVRGPVQVFGPLEVFTAADAPPRRPR